MITYPGIFFMNKVQVFWAMIWRGGDAQRGVKLIERHGVSSLTIFLRPIK
jgi:hypothetical protein